MKLPYIFAHRGGMAVCIENTISCFKKAVNVGAGIESDVQLTKDHQLICFHDPFIGIGDRQIFVKDLTFQQLNKVNFGDQRKVPRVREVFETFLDQKSNLRYSFDIRGKEVGQKLIDLAMEYQILGMIEITERRLTIIRALRTYNKDVPLVHTLNESIRKITTDNVKFSKLLNLGVKAINLKGLRVNFENLKLIIDNSLECYAWDINREKRMMRLLNLKYKDHGIAAIYTDNPKLLLNCIDNITPER